MSNTDGWPLRHTDPDLKVTAQRILNWCTETGLQPGYTEVENEVAHENERVPYRSKPGVERVEHRDVALDGSDRFSYRLDIDSHRIEMQKRIADIEDSMLAGIVADEMRRRGYTVIPPEDTPAA